MYVAFFQNYPTGNNKFADINAFRKFIQNSDRNYQTMYDKRAELCIVSNSTGYIDFSNDSKHANEIFSYNGGCYYTITGSQANITDFGSYTNFFAFTIDRIEVNNFNTTPSRTYRAYFTIDWWTTINCLWNNDLRSSLSGRVLRAHVNDMVDEGNNKLSLNVKNTTIECEYGINRWKRKATEVVNTDGGLSGNTPYFLYIASTKDKVVFLKNDTQSNIPNKEVGSSFPIYAIPMLQNKQKYVLRARAELNPDFDPLPNKVWELDSISDVDYLSDSSIIQMVVSRFIPNEITYDNSYAIYNDDGTIQQVGAWIINCVIDLSFVRTRVEAENIFNKFEPIEFDHRNSTVDRNPSKAIPVQYIDKAIITDSTVTTPLKLFDYPNTFYEYLELQAKSHYFPYNYSFIQKSDKKVFIDSAYIYSDTLSAVYMLDGLNGYYITKESTLYEGEESYDVIMEIAVFQPSAIQDKFTRLSAWTEGVGNYLGILGNFSSGESLFSVNTLQKGFQAMNADVRIAKMMRDGENGTKAIPSATSNLYDGLQYCRVKPNDLDMEELRLNLAYYGVTTFIDASQILRWHRRSNFQYIQTVDITISTSLLPEQREQIASMFNGGVFLWEEQSFETSPYYNKNVINLPQEL